MSELGGVWETMGAWALVAYCTLWLSPVIEFETMG